MSEMGDLERFREEVLADEGLQQQLRDTEDTTSFMKLMIHLGQSRGYEFTESEVEDALSAARRTWIERWIG